MEGNLQERVHAKLKGSTLKGLSVPIHFSTNKTMTARTGSGPHRPLNGYIEVYFSDEPIDCDEAKNGKSWTKEFALYMKRNAYGPHRFLVPTKSERIEPYEPIDAARTSLKRINEDPTTAVCRQNLQLIPCSAPNLGLFLERLQTNPFYIEVTEQGFVLHVRDESGQYRQILGQDYSPPCWHGYAHPVMTLWSSRPRFPQLQPQPFYELDEIPWADLASSLGT